MLFLGILTSLLGPILIGVFVIVLIVVVVKARSNSTSKSFTEKDGEIMLKNIYTYVVLFVTLMMAIGGSVSVFMGVAEYASPSIYAETYDQYKQEHSLMDKNEATLRSEYEAMKQEKIDEARADAIRHIIQSSGWIIIPLPIFIYFQRQRNRESA